VKMSESREFTAGNVDYRVHSNGRVEWRYSGASRWLRESNSFIESLAIYAAQMEARANEYHDTTMKQAKRIAMLEEAVESYQMRILELERILTPDQRRLISCPCGGDPDHGAEWCSDFT
jgi:hypothetical protein